MKQLKIKTVEMTREIRNKQFLLTKDMSDRELIDYFKQKAKKLHKELSESLQKQCELTVK